MIRMLMVTTRPKIFFSKAFAPTETQINTLGTLEIPYITNNLGAFTGVSPAIYIMISFGIKGMQQIIKRPTVPFDEFSVSLILSILFSEINLETSSYPKILEI